MASVGQGLITNQAALLDVRFLLGVTEAGLFPGVIFLFSAYYRLLRAAIFFGGAALTWGVWSRLLTRLIEDSDAGNKQLLLPPPSPDYKSRRFLYRYTPRARIGRTLQLPVESHLQVGKSGSAARLQVAAHAANVQWNATHRDRKTSGIAHHPPCCNSVWAPQVLPSIIWKILSFCAHVQLRQWRRSIIFTLSIMGILCILLYAPSEAPICKVGLIKENDFFRLCSTQTLPLTARRTDPLDRREGWGVSRLAEMVVVAHNNITLSKFDLTTLGFISFATKAGEEMLSQTRLLEDVSFDALKLVNKFVKTMCDDLDFLLISYHDVDIHNIVFSAELTVSDAGSKMGSSLANAMGLGNMTLKQVDSTIALLNTTYSALCTELGWRDSGYFPWRWWYPRVGEHRRALLNVQLRFSDALFDLKMAATGLDSLLTDMQLLERSSERTDVTKGALAKQNVLKLVGTRLSSLLRTEGEVDIMAMAGAALVGSRQPRLIGSSQTQEVVVVEKAAIRPEAWPNSTIFTYYKDTPESFEDREEHYLTYVGTRYPLNVPSTEATVSPAVRVADCLRIIRDAGRAVRALAPSGLVNFATTQVDRALDCPSIAVNLLRHIAMHAKYLCDTATSASDAMREADPHCSELDKARVPLARLWG
ncbi:hypothetical protein BDZ89DRAFT_1046805 [Hymenopellis radicata]|nr:hypothetical protein BDZ89DRAFT_1046805 [Hymenopellis radicata]